MSTRTSESVAEEATFIQILQAVPGLRLRVTLDAEDWPMVKGLYGRLEWRGEAPGGSEVESPRLYAYTDRNRILSRLTAVPGTRPCQAGDDEGVVSMAAEDHPAILAVARLLRSLPAPIKATPGFPSTHTPLPCFPRSSSPSPPRSSRRRRNPAEPPPPRAIPGHFLPPATPR